MATAELSINHGISLLKEKFPEWRKAAFDFIGTHPFTTSLVRKMSSFLIDTGTEMIDFNFAELDKLGSLLKPSFLLLFVANHLSHADTLVGFETVSEARKKFPAIGTVYFPVSQTIESGRQNGIGQTFYHNVAVPMFELYGIKPVYVVTRNDRTRRGVPLSREEAMAQIQRLIEPVKEQASAYFVLPEGSVEGGRHNKDGTVKGMQTVRNSFLRVIFEAAKENNRKIICVPIGIDHTYRILSAEHIFFTRDSFVALISKLVGGKVKIVGRATVGTPFIINPEVNPRQLNDIIMKEYVAPLVSLEARGVNSKDNPQFLQSTS